VSYFGQGAFGTNIKDLMILATRVEQIGVQSVEAAGVPLCHQARQLAQHG
jgi:hypothetical protein